MTIKMKLPEGLRELLPRLELRKSVAWQEYQDAAELDMADGLEDGQIATSRIKMGPSMAEDRHIIALDIDYPAYVVPSSTPGHFHLYLDVPGGVAHEDYMDLVNLLGAIGAVEPGYAAASEGRGFTSLRLPWVKKPTPPEAPVDDSNMLEFPETPAQIVDHTLDRTATAFGLPF